MRVPLLRSCAAAPVTLPCRGMHSVISMTSAHALTWTAMTRPACGSIAGYPVCLKATNTLREAGVLTEQLPGKADGAPGNAFGLVYERMAGRVWSKLYAADGVVAEWIRWANGGYVAQLSSCCPVFLSSTPSDVQDLMHIVPHDLSGGMRTATYTPAPA